MTAAEGFKCFIDNEPATFERKRNLFWSGRTGHLLGGPEEALANRHFALEPAVMLEGVAYYAGKWVYRRVGHSSEELALHEFEERVAEGAGAFRPNGSEFRDCLRKEWSGLWEAGTGEHENYEGRKLEWVYLDNVPCLHDVKHKCFRFLDGDPDISERTAREGGMYLSRLRIGVLDGKAYYVPDNAEEMSRVGRPSERITFEAMDMLAGEGWFLSFPGEGSLRKVLQKEMALDADLPRIKLHGREYIKDERFRECRRLDDRMHVVALDSLVAHRDKVKEPELDRT